MVGNTRRMARTSLPRITAAITVGLMLLWGLSVPATAQVTPGANLDYDAALDDGADNVWENTGTTSGRNITNLVSYTFVTPTTSLPGITKAYSFTSGGGNLQTLDGLGNGQPASFEMWFRPTDLIGDERLFETGGGNGVGITLGGGTQAPGQTSSAFFSVTQNSGGSQTARVSSDLSGIGVGEFIQVVGTFDAATSTAAMYVNGLPVGANTATAAITDWSGGDAAGVGILGGSNQGGYGGGAMGFADYDGEIAIFRFYQNKLLTPAEVAQNYHAIAGTTDMFFDNDGGDGKWDTNANWGPEPGLQPSAAENAYIGNGLAAAISQPGEAAADVTVGHNVAAFLPGTGTLTIDGASASLDAVRLRIGTDGQDGTVDFVTGTMTLTGTGSDQALYVGQDNGSTGTLTMGTLGGNDADTTLVYNGGRFEVCQNTGATGTFTLNSGTVTGTQNFIVTQGNGTAYVNVHGGSFTTTTDMNFNSGNGYYTQDGGFMSVRDLQQSNNGSRASVITVDGGILEVRDDLNERAGTSTINLGGTGRLELVGNSTNRETENFNHSGNGALQLALYNNTTGVSAPLTVTSGTFADTPTIELDNRIPANAATIVDWVDGTDTWDADPVGKWAGDVLPSNGANTIVTGTAITVITSPNDLSNPGALASGTAGWTVNLPDTKTVEMVLTGNPVGGPATARISGATSIVTRNTDLHVAPELGTDAAGLILGSGASLTLTGASALTIGGGVTATVDHHGGTLSVAGDLLFGGGFGNQGGVYNLNGGALNVGGDIVEGDSGAPSSGVNNAQLHINAGTLSVAGDITVQRFSIGEAATSNGASYTIPFGQDVYSTGSTVVGSQGTNAALTVNGTLTADGTSWVAEKASSSGTLTVNPGASVTINNSWEIGDAAGADGTVLLNGGTFTVTKGWNQATHATANAELTVEDGAVLNVSGGNFETALSGTGKVVWEGGTLNQTNNNVIVGQNTGSDATFEVYGGTLSLANQLRITNKVDIAGRVLLYGGTVNVGSQLDTFNTAGTNTTGFATIVVDDTHAGSNAPAVLDVGTHLVLGNTNVSGGTTQMDLVSGTVTVGSNLRLAPGAGNAATFNLMGGLLDMTGGNVEFGSGAGSTPTFNFTGGILKDCADFGSTLVQQGGTLAPGGSIGTTTVDGDYMLGSAGTLEIEIDSTGADLLIVNGDVSIEGSLSAILGFGPAFGDEWTIVRNDGTAPIDGIFAGLPEYSFFGETFDGRDYAFRISYVAGDGNDVALKAVPEPATLTLLALGGLALVRRRKRRQA